MKKAGESVVAGLAAGLEAEINPAIVALVQRAWESAGGDSAVEAMCALSEENRRNKND
jgi:hypothetical protein